MRLVELTRVTQELTEWTEREECLFGLVKNREQLSNAIRNGRQYD